MRRRSVVSIVIILLLAQLALLAGFAVILFRTELAQLSESEAAGRLHPFLEFGRRVDSALSALYRGPQPDHTLPNYVIDIAPEHMSRLQQSLPVGKAVFDDELVPWVPGIFTAEGTRYPVHIRVYGASSAHWARPKQSFEVRFDDEKFHERSSILLLLPEETGWMTSPLLHQRSALWGLLTPESAFVSLTLNGRGPMVYLEEEIWNEEAARSEGRGGQLVLYTLRPESGEEGMLDPASWERTGDATTSADDALATLLELSQPGADQDADFLARLGQVADIDRLSATLALTLRMGNPELDPERVHLLYRGDRGVFEVVLWDVPLRAPRSILAPSGFPLLDAASRVPLIRSRAQQLLFHALDNADTDRMFIAGMRRDIEAPLYADRTKLPSNRVVRNALDQFQKIVEDIDASLQSQIQTSEVLINERLPAAVRGSLLLTIDSTARGPVAALLSRIVLPERFATIASGLRVFRDTGDGTYGAEDLAIAIESTGSTLLFPEDDTRLLWPGDPGLTADHDVLRPPYRRHRFFLVGSASTPRLTPQELPLSLQIDDAVTGGNGTVLGRAVIDERTFAESVPPSEDRSVFLSTYPQFDEKGASEISLSGNVSFTDTVIIPEGLPLTIEPGTTIRMARNSSFLSYSPIHAVGTEDAPIQVIPAESGGRWGSLAVVDADEPSDFQFVALERGGDTTVLGIALPAALSILRSPAAIVDTLITDPMGGGIALSHLFADIRKTTIERPKGTGIFVDHALAGRLEQIHISDAEGDGIELRWSPVVLRRIIVEKAAKACIAVRERSTPLIEESRLEGCAVGLLVTDGSSAVVNTLSVVENDVGMQAAPGMLGPGSIVATNTAYFSNDIDTQTMSGGIILDE